MRTGVALVGPVDEGEILQWDFVLSHWTVDDIYLIGDIPASSKPFKEAARLPMLGNLPRDATLVCMAPAAGLHVQGDVSLSAFEHPQDAIYIFGSNHHHLQAECDFDYKVFIETSTHHEMYSYVAAAITLYDRHKDRG